MEPLLFERFRHINYKKEATRKIQPDCFFFILLCLSECIYDMVDPKDHKIKTDKKT